VNEVRWTCGGFTGEAATRSEKWRDLLVRSAMRPLITHRVSLGESDTPFHFAHHPACKFSTPRFTIVSLFFFLGCLMLPFLGGFWMTSEYWANLQWSVGLGGYPAAWHPSTPPGALPAGFHEPGRPPLRLH